MTKISLFIHKAKVKASYLLMIAGRLLVIILCFHDTVTILFWFFWGGVRFVTEFMFLSKLVVLYLNIKPFIIN